MSKSSHRDNIVDQFTRQAVPFSTAAPIRDETALQLIVDTAGAGSHDTVLDVACGPGLVAAAFARVAQHVTGIDLTPAMIERARTLTTEQGLSNVTFHVGDVSPLPYADGSFSIVVSRFAFHHFQDPAAVIAEMRRVCRVGGRVVVADLTASPDPVKAEAFHQMEILRDPSHARALTLDQLRGLFRAAGLHDPCEAFWKMEIDVEGLMQRSFPVPTNEPVIRQAFADSLAGDAMGLDLRCEDGRLRFSYSNVVLSAVRA